MLDLQEEIQKAKVERLASDGNMHAQFILGKCYVNGNGVPQSYEKAVEWYMKAENQGSAEAQSNLGALR